MIIKIILSLSILGLTFTGLEAKEDVNEVRIKREFTVTSLALDAQNARLQTEENEDNNDTNTQGGAPE